MSHASSVLLAHCLYSINSLYLVYSSLGFNCKPNSFNFASTSSSDLRPRLRTFIISSEVRLQSSSTVLMPARFKQLYVRTDYSNSSMFISRTFSFSLSSFSIMTSAVFALSDRSIKRLKCSLRTFAARLTASSASKVPLV